MNYFAHAINFLDRPYFAVGTGVPDWLTVCDRGVRMRSRYLEAFRPNGDSRVGEVVDGILQHIRDDGLFHQSRAFAELSLELTVESREALQHDSGFRPGFLGHLLVELLLDASLVAENPGKIEDYYRLLGSIDATVVQATVNSVGPRQTERLATMISRFHQERILCDYLEDAKLMERLNQIMSRVKLRRLPESFIELLPLARKLVENRREELLEVIL
jgi:hypothetical protein